MLPTVNELTRQSNLPHFEQLPLPFALEASGEVWSGQTYFDYAAESWLLGRHFTPQDVMIARMYTHAYACARAREAGIEKPEPGTFPQQYASIYRYSLVKAAKAREALVMYKATRLPVVGLN